MNYADFVQSKLKSGAVILEQKTPEKGHLEHMALDRGRHFADTNSEIDAGLVAAAMNSYCSGAAKETPPDG